MTAPADPYVVYDYWGTDYVDDNNSGMVWVPVLEHDSDWTPSPPLSE